MRKVFQHKYIVRLLALAALALTLLFISAPKIEQYNQTIQKEQIELRRKSDGRTTPSRFDFSGGIDYGLRTDFYAVAMSFSLFLSLLLTRRIIFSLLSAFLYAFQHITLYPLIFGDFEDIEFSMRKELISYLYHASDYELFFINSVCIICLLALTYWQSSVICRYSRAVSSGFKTKIISVP